MSFSNKVIVTDIKYQCIDNEDNIKQFLTFKDTIHMY